MTNRSTSPVQTRSLVAHPRTRKDVDGLPFPDQLAMIRDIRLYPRQVAHVLTRLEYLMHSSNTGVLLTGPANVGKATLLNEFAKKHPVIVREDLPNDLQPVIFATPTSRVDAVGIADAIARDAAWPHFVGTSQKAPEHQVGFLLEKSETKVLLLYHAHMLADGKGKFSQDTLPFIVNLRDRATATLCLVGDEKLVDIIEKSGLADSFFQRLSLKPMEFDADWKKLIRNMKSQLPFDFSVLELPHMDRLLHMASLGKIPNLINYTEAAAVCAVYDDAKTVVTLKHFEKAYEDRHPGEPNPFDPKIDAATLLERAKDVARDGASDALRISNRRNN
jgi:GTPase SAR1 family protein